MQHPKLKVFSLLMWVLLPDFMYMNRKEIIPVREPEIAQRPEYIYIQKKKKKKKKENLN